MEWRRCKCQEAEEDLVEAAEGPAVAGEDPAAVAEGSAADHTAGTEAPVGREDMDMAGDIDHHPRRIIITTTEAAVLAAALRLSALSC